MKANVTAKSSASASRRVRRKRAREEKKKHARQQTRTSVRSSIEAVMNIAPDRVEDRFEGLRAGLDMVGRKNDLWAGVPMPLEGERLIIEPRYPNADLFMGMCAGAVDAKPQEPVDFKVRTSFWSSKLRSTVVTFDEADGRVTHGVLPGANHIGHALRTVGCSAAWGIAQETKALQTLATLVSDHQYKQYVLAGAFLETSKRSRVTYMFRKLRPTIALTSRSRRGDGQVRVLCTLCLHPIGYYQDSWAGAMCPTDDVIAHLTMMRGDEPLYWRRANQVAAWLPEAGV